VSQIARSVASHPRWSLAAFSCAAALPLLFDIARPALAEPELVVLVRHGHKDNLSGGQPNYNLSATGLLQALYLGHLLSVCVVPKNRLHLASYGFNQITGKNARSYQTLVPLAVATGANIRVYPDAERRSEQIGREVRADVQVSGGSVVMAWEHRHLPELALGLGWSQMPLVRDDDFDGIWLLRYSGSLAEPEVTMLSQSQLRQQKCFHSAGPGGHPLQQLAKQLLSSFQ